MQVYIIINEAFFLHIELVCPSLKDIFYKVAINKAKINKTIIYYFRCFSLKYIEMM